MIYISTGGFKFKTSFESVQELIKKGIKSIELSGGIYEKDQIQKLYLLKS